MINHDFLLGYGAGKAAGGGGGGGEQIETGTWKPSENVSRGEILFTKQHETPPVIVCLADAEDEQGANTVQANSNILFIFADVKRMFDRGYYYALGGDASISAFNSCTVLYRTSSASGVSTGALSVPYGINETGSSTQYARYFVNETRMFPYGSSATKYWRKDRTYKWIAVWI